MVLTEDVHLPEDSELTVSEVHLSSSTLIAGSFHLGKYCEQANNVSKSSLFNEALSGSCCCKSRLPISCMLQLN